MIFYWKKMFIKTVIRLLFIVTILSIGQTKATSEPVVTSGPTGDMSISNVLNKIYLMERFLKESCRHHNTNTWEPIKYCMLCYKDPIWTKEFLEMPHELTEIHTLITQHYPKSLTLAIHYALDRNITAPSHSIMLIIKEIYSCMMLSYKILTSKPEDQYMLMRIEKDDEGETDGLVLPRITATSGQPELYTRSFLEFCCLDMKLDLFLPDNDRSIIFLRTVVKKLQNICNQVVPIAGGITKEYL